YFGCGSALEHFAARWKHLASHKCGEIEFGLPHDFPKSLQLFGIMLTEGKDRWQKQRPRKLPPRPKQSQRRRRLPKKRRLRLPQQPSLLLRSLPPPRQQQPVQSATLRRSSALSSTSSSRKASCR